MGRKKGWQITPSHVRMSSVKAQGYVILTLKFQKQGRRWTALCEELGTATFGRSLPEADQRLKDAILLHLNTLEDVDERERFFKENKIPVPV